MKPPIPVLILAAVLASFAGLASGQVFERPSLLSAAEIDLLDSASATHLENARRFLAEKQWEEAVDAIRRVMEGDAARYVKAGDPKNPDGFERFVPTREFCQWELAALSREAPAALVHYRKLVDPLAERWFRQGMADHDESLFLRVIEQAFASKWGDDALLRMGDLALQRGEYARARGYFRRIAPGLESEDASEANGGVAKDSQVAADLYPDTDLNLADIRARLVLVSLMEGSLARAKLALATLAKLHPAAEGQVGGRVGKYADILAAILLQAESWPPAKPTSDWLTLGGDTTRNGKATADVDIAGQPLWTVPLPKLRSDNDLIGSGRLRVADDMNGLLSYFPVVTDNSLLLRSDARGKSFITALDMVTGATQWRVEERRGLDTPEEPDDGPPLVSDAHAGLRRQVGVARYTMTIHGHKLFARIGTPVVAPSARKIDRLLVKDQAWILGLDLRSQGKPLDGFPLQPESNNWSFEGTPVADDGHLYVGMRRVEQGRCQMHLACFELLTTPSSVTAGSEGDTRNVGRMKWRTKLCSAATLGGGDIDELIPMLLSYDSGTLYCNTNQGVVAAVSASEGRVQWLMKYPRGEFRSNDPDNNESHFFRDLNPCLIAKDQILVAPTDCNRLFSLDRVTGRLNWATPPGLAADALHLLGATSSSLIASGDYLYWLDLQTGKLQTQFPPPAPQGPMFAAPSPRGIGRGLLAGEHVYWPTRENIYVFDQSPAKTERGLTARGIREIPLVPRGVTGGNLLIIGDKLIIAAGDKLALFGEAGPPRPPRD